MQEGSLITPSEEFFDSLPDVFHFYGKSAEFIPKIPERGQIYICKEVYREGRRGRICVLVDNFILKIGGLEVPLNIELWDELQPPMEVNIEELMPEEAFVTV